MKTRAQFTRFILVGVFATIINYGVFTLLLHWLGHNYYTLSSSLGFITGVIAGYIPNQKWSFQSKANQKLKAIKYLLVYTTSLFISILIIRLLVELIKIDVKIANLITICITTIVNFIGAKFFVFSNDTKQIISTYL